MKKTMFTLLGIALSTMLFAQDQILMTINNKPVKASEFMYIYEKNNQESAMDPKTMDEYLDLFINFKLKVAEAESQGLDTTEAFRKELAGYRAQATPKYLQDKEAIDSLVNLSYAHLSKDRRAAHIAIQCPQNASDSAVQTALKKINDARERVTVGKVIKKATKKSKEVRQIENFFDVAQEVSTDPSVSETKGELGWIVPFRYVYPFEEAVYNTPVGEVSQVFRTAYGFHIALVEEESDHQEVHASHIMKMVPRGNEEASKTAKVQIDSIAQILTTANFAEKAGQLSDDKGSAMRGGDLGWFSRGAMVKPFEETVFSMKEGEISAPFTSNFGWHIIYMQGRRGIQPLDTIRPQILRQVQRDERIQEADKAFIRKARVEYQLPDSMTDKDVKAYVDSHLEEKYPDLKNLVQEYHDGILLFDVSLKEVWDKAGKDTVGLENFFNTNKANYTWDKPKYKGFVVYCKDKATANAAKAIIRNANPDSVENYLNKRLNLDSVTYVRFSRGLWEQGQNKAVDKYGFKVKKANYTPTEDLPYVFCVGKKIKNPEEYTDERGKVTADYQDYLEKEWVKELRSKYNVVVDQKVFESLKK